MTCEVCNFSLHPAHVSRMHRHHIRPKSHGGDDIDSNLITLCPNCHTIAHILLAEALVLSSSEIYKLWTRDWLVLAISKYTYTEPAPLAQRKSSIHVRIRKLIKKISKYTLRISIGERTAKVDNGAHDGILRSQRSLPKKRIGEWH